jgi:hypothetical protein
MADMQNQFRAAMDEEAAAAPATEPVMADDSGDAVCPACGASAMKIVQAAQGGGGMPPIA